jgi:hypothetical protein
LYYFPVLLRLKWTMGTLALLGVAIWVYASGHIRKPREIIFLVLPAIVYFVIAVAGPLNLGVRHILPIFPFIFALVGAAMAHLAARSLSQLSAFRQSVLGRIVEYLSLLHGLGRGLGAATGRGQGVDGPAQHQRMRLRLLCGALCDAVRLWHSMQVAADPRH